MRRGLSLVEALVSVAVCLAIISALYAFLSRVFGERGAAQATTASFLRQDARLAFESLMARLEEGIEVLSPGPNDSAAELEFKDVLNHHTVLAVSGGALVSSRVQGGARTVESQPKTVTAPGGAPVVVAMPVRVPGVRAVRFTALSPTLVSIVLTVVDGDRSGSLVATARLRNFRQVAE